MSGQVSVSEVAKKNRWKSDTVTIKINGSERFRQTVVNDIFRFVLYSDEINYGDEAAARGMVEISSTLEPTLDEEG